MLIFTNIYTFISNFTAAEFTIPQTHSYAIFCHMHCSRKQRGKCKHSNAVIIFTTMYPQLLQKDLWIYQWMKHFCKYTRTLACSLCNRKHS